MTVTARLDEVATLNPRLRVRPSDNTIVSFLGMADVGTDGSTTEGNDRPFKEVAKGYTHFERGDILVAKITPCFENGKIAQARTRHIKAAGSTEFHVVRPNPQVLDGRYLHHYLRQSLIRIEGERRMTGSGGQRRVPESYLAQLQVPIPPIDEQQWIAGMLDQAHELQAKRRQAITLLDDLAQSIFMDMFGSDSDHSLTPLGPRLNFVTSGGRGWAKYYVPSGSRFIRSLDVRMNDISSQDAVYVKAPDNAEARRTRVAAGDVLLTITGSLIGRVAAAGEQHEGSYISQHVAILRTSPDELDPHFLAFYLSLPSGGQRQIKRMQYGQTKPGLNFDQIRAFRIPDVPIEGQRKFVAILYNIQKQALQARRQLAHIDELYASLEAHAFRGRL